MFRGSQKKEPRKDDLFDIDYAHGIIKRKKDGIRIFAVGSPGWATLEQELASTFISGASVILQRMGYSYGRYLGRTARSEQKTAEQTLESLQGFAKDAGLGELVLVGGDLSRGQARLVLRDCIFCLHIKEASEPVCYMLAGLIGGVTDEMIGFNHRVLEEKCIAKGDPHCEIAVERMG